MVLLLSLLLACRTHPRAGTTEAVEDRALPPAVIEFRDSLRSAETLRAWIADPQAMRGCSLTSHHRLHRSIVSVHSSGILTVDSWDERRTRWAAGEHPPDRPLVLRDGKMVHTFSTAVNAESVARAAIVQTFIATLRSPDARWVSRKRALSTVLPAEIEVRAWGGFPDKWRIYVRFGFQGQPTEVAIENPQRSIWDNSWINDWHLNPYGNPERITLSLVRLELNPELPPNWFGTEAPDIMDKVRIFDTLALP